MTTARVPHYRVALIDRDDLRVGDVLYAVDKILLATDEVNGRVRATLGDLGQGGMGVMSDGDPRWWDWLEPQEWVYLHVDDDRLASAEQVKPGRWSEEMVWRRLTTDDVAVILGVSVASVRQYATRGDLPEPDGYLSRTPWWRPETILAWRDARPGQGKGGGRPRKSTG